MCNTKCGMGGCSVSMVVKILLVVGGLNWGLVGIGMLFGASESWNVVGMVLGSMPVFEAIVYLLVGVSAVLTLIGCKCQKCMEACGSCQTGGGEQKM